MLQIDRYFQRKSSALWIEIRHAKQMSGYSTRYVRQINSFVGILERCSSKYYMYATR